MLWNRNALWISFHIVLNCFESSSWIPEGFRSSRLRISLNSSLRLIFMSTERNTLSYPLRLRSRGGSGGRILHLAFRHLSFFHLLLSSSFTSSSRLVTVVLWQPDADPMPDAEPPPPHSLPHQDWNTCLLATCIQISGKGCWLWHKNDKTNIHWNSHARAWRCNDATGEQRTVDKALECWIFNGSTLGILGLDAMLKRACYFYY